MSLPYAPNDPAAPPVRAVPMPATPGSPLEPLRDGRRSDRRHWLLAGLLGIAGGSIALSGVVGPLNLALRDLDAYGAELLVLEAARIAFGVVLVIVAYVLAPGRGGRTAAGIAVLLLGVALALLVQMLLLFAVSLPARPVFVAVVSGASVLLFMGAIGWALASGARWYGFLAALLAPAAALAQWASNLAGLPSVLAQLAVLVVSLAIALVTLLLTLPRRR